jgi:hypothetical protein
LGQEGGEADYQEGLGASKVPMPEHASLKHQLYQPREKAMNENELHQQKYQPQMDEWEAGIAKIKAQAKLAKLAEAPGNAWNFVKNSVEFAWDSLMSAVSGISGRFKN